jgi:hypothetical protein
VALAKERKIRRREHLEQHNEEYRLREQQGLSLLPVLVNSSSNEESDKSGPPLIGGSPHPPSPRAEGAAMELVPEAGSEPPAAGLSVEVPVGATEAPVGAAEVPPALKEEEAGILQFEVSSVSPRAPSILRGNRSPFPPLSSSEGCKPSLPLLRRRGDAQRGCRGRHDRDRKIAVGRGGGGEIAGAGPPGPSPRAWAGSFGEPVRRGPRGGGGPC